MLFVGEGGYQKYFSTVTKQLQDSQELALLNGNNLANLPDLQVGVPNYSKGCKQGAVYLGTNVTNPAYCKQVCGSEGKIIQIDKDATYYINGTKLTEGSWCVTHEPIECNTSTGYVLAGVNGAVCRSKFPEIIGGEKANKIEACNDSIINSTNSKLMDRLHNEQVSLSTVFTDVDEKLENGEFRFVCEPGRDIHGNKYLIHPEARFHVIPDPCKESGAKLHDSVGLKYTQDNNWYCDCGKFEETRVSNFNSRNAQTTCTNCILEKKEDLVKIPYQCVTGDSYFDYLGVIPLCEPQKFINKGAECSQIELTMVKVIDELDAPFAGVSIDRVHMDSQEITKTWPF